MANDINQGLYYIKILDSEGQKSLKSRFSCTYTEAEKSMGEMMSDYQTLSSLQAICWAASASLQLLCVLISFN